MAEYPEPVTVPPVPSGHQFSHTQTFYSNLPVDQLDRKELARVARGICSALLSTTPIIQRSACRKKGRFGIGRVTATGADFARCVHVSSCNETGVLPYM